MRYYHTMVRIRDINESLKFFCDLLGLKEVKRKEDDKGRYTLIFLTTDQDSENFKNNDSPALELTYNWDPEKYSNGRNFGHLAYSVKNIYDTCKNLMNNGVTINRPPRDGRMAFIKSPDGISIEILQEGEALEIIDPWKSMSNEGDW